MMQNGKLPACFANRCAIQDIMASPECSTVERQVEAFLEVESLSDSAGYSSLQDRITREGGLDQLPGKIILQMRRVLIEYRNHVRSMANG